MIKELDWDSKFFGYKIGSHQGKPLEGKTADEFVKEFHDKKFDCVYVFCDAKGWVCEQLKKNKHILSVGGHAEYELTKENWKRKGDGRTRDIRIFNKEVAASNYNIAVEIKMISRSLVPISRFYYDPRFKIRAEDMYEIWADKIINSDQGEIAIEMIDGQVAGIIGYIMDKGIGRISLVKTKTVFEGRGVASMLLDRALGNLFKSGASKIMVTTQADNKLAERLYQNAGFEIKKITTIYHWWTK